MWQERFWSVQRLGWLLMLLLVIAALAGATGKGGPLAAAVVQTPEGSVNYPRVTRWQSDEEVVLQIPSSSSDKFTLLASNSFSEVFGIDSIVPEPVEAKATPAGHSFTFSTPGTGPKRIVLHVTAGKPVIARPVDLRVGQSRARVRVTVLP